MEKLLQKLVQSSGLDAIAQRLGPRLAAQYGPLLSKKTNELIRQHLPWWPF